MVDLAAVVGSGSAGYRHASTLRRLYPDLRIVVVRRPESIQPLDRLEALDLDVVSSVEEAALMGPVVAVVAGPASTHRRDAEILAEVGAHLLVEKPLALTASDAREMVSSCDEAGCGLVVGYHLRFSRTVPMLASMVDSGVIGTPRSFAFGVGQHLSQWRPGLDPRQSVTARKELGGGVLLELSHELDGLRFVLGEAATCKASFGFDGAPTDGLVETVADLEIELDSGVQGTVHLDMVSEAPFRKWVVQGSDGEISANLLNGTITVSHGSDREILQDDSPNERDLAETRLIENLMAVSSGRAEPLCSGADGVAVLEVIEAARVSNAQRSTCVRVGAGPTDPSPTDRRTTSWT